MTSFEALAEVAEDGTLSVRAPSSVAAGRKRVVVVVEDGAATETSRRRRLPDLAEFRAGLQGRPYPGNSVVDMRDEER